MYINFKKTNQTEVETVGINNNNVKVILMPQKKFFKKIISYRMNDSEGDDENNYDDDRWKIPAVMAQEDRSHGTLETKFSMICISCILNVVYIYYPKKCDDAKEK